MRRLVASRDARGSIGHGIRGRSRAAFAHAKSPRGRTPFAHGGPLRGDTRAGNLRHLRIERLGDRRPSERWQTRSATSRCAAAAAAVMPPRPVLLEPRLQRRPGHAVEHQLPVLLGALRSARLPGRLPARHRPLLRRPRPRQRWAQPTWTPCPPSTTTRPGNSPAYESHFGGALIDTDPYPANGCTQAAICLTDAQLRAELTSYVEAHGLPADLTHEYFLLTPPGVESCFEAAGVRMLGRHHARPEYCAYHGDVPVGRRGDRLRQRPLRDGQRRLRRRQPPQRHQPPTACCRAASATSTTSRSPTPSRTTPGRTSAAAAARSATSAAPSKKPREFGTPLGSARNGAKYNQVINGALVLVPAGVEQPGPPVPAAADLRGAEPTATFTSTPEAGNEVSFDASGSTAPGGVARVQLAVQRRPRESLSTPVETTTPTVTHTFRVSRACTRWR